MNTFPSVGVLPTGSVTIDSPIVVVGLPAAIALGFLLALVVGLVCVARLRGRPRRTLGPGRLPAAAHLALRSAASKGRC